MADTDISGLSIFSSRLRRFVLFWNLPNRALVGLKRPGRAFNHRLFIESLPRRGRLTLLKPGAFLAPGFSFGTFTNPQGFWG